jgi:ketosteroid isomerase-like protein
VTAQPAAPLGSKSSSLGSANSEAVASLLLLAGAEASTSLVEAIHPPYSASVSGGNVEAVQGLIAALNRRDVDALVNKFYSADAEFMPALQAALEGTVYRGSDAIRAYYDEIYEVFGELRFDVTDLRDLGDTVRATGRLVARGKGSGLDLDSPLAVVFRLRNGKVVWQQNFLDPAEVLRSSGIA